MNTVLAFCMQYHDGWHIRVKALNEAAQRRGWRMQVVNQPAKGAIVAKLRRFWRPDGIVIVGTPQGRRPLPKEVFGDVPTVFIDCDPALLTPGCPNVLHDTRAICETAIRELLATGCQEIGYVGWYRRTFWCDEKRRFCRETLELHGKSLPEFIPSSREANDAALLNQRLCKWIRSLPKPCGVFAVNDTLAEAVIDAATACKVDMPSDLAVIGVNDDPSIVERTSPSLTSFPLNYPGIAEAALSVLEKRSGGGRERTVLVPAGKLIRRHSTRRFKRKDPEAEAAVEMIRRRACEGLRPAEVLKTFSRSVRLAEMRFKALTGHSVLEEIAEVRFVRLFELLSDDRLPIGALADLCGFPSPLVLRRQFKARTGLTLSGWRKANACGPGGVRGIGRGISFMV